MLKEPITWIIAHIEFQIKADSIISLDFANNAFYNTFLNNTKGNSKLKFFSKHTRNGVITLLEEGAEREGKGSEESFYYFPLQNSH